MPSEKPGKPISEAEIERRLTPTGTPPSAKILAVGVSKKELHIRLADGRTLFVPFTWYPTLLRANQDQRLDFRIIGAGYALEWENLDFQLSLQGMLAGRRERGREVPQP